MKANYLIQVQTRNPNMGATGWMTLHRAPTRKAADSLADEFRRAQAALDARAVRAVSARAFALENVIL